MAYPAVQGTTTYAGDTGTTAFSATLPANVAAGELLLIFLATDGGGRTLSSLTAGWSQVAVDGGTMSGFLLWKPSAAGGETTVTATISASEAYAYTAYRISGGTITGTWYASYAPGSSGQPDPPNLASPYAAGAEILWFASGGWDGNRTVSTYPSGWDNNHAYYHVATSTGCSLASCSLNSTTTPQDPGAFAIIAADDEYVAFTVAIGPGSPSASVSAGVATIAVGALGSGSMTVAEGATGVAAPAAAAYNAYAFPTQTVSAGVAAVAVASAAAVPSPSPNAGIAAVTSAALAPVAKPGATAGVAEVTSAAPTAVAKPGAAAGVAVVTSAAASTTATVSGSIGASAVAVAALEPTVEIGAPAPEEHVDAGIAEVAAGVYGLAASISGSVGVAESVAAGQGATATVAATLGVAASTAAASGASASVAVPIGASAVTAAAPGPSAVPGGVVGAGVAETTVAAAGATLVPGGVVGAGTAAVASAAPTAGATVAAPLGVAEAIAAAWGASVPCPVWTTPGDGAGITSTPTLAFTMPLLASAMHFYLELDTADTFDTADLVTYRSDAVQAGWDYYDGADWQDVAPSGVPAIYGGNEARLIVPDALDDGTWYRRVRAGV